MKVVEKYRIIQYPCTILSFCYEYILVKLNPMYHTICSSSFVHSVWIDGYITEDVRFLDTPSFQLAKLICSLPNETVHNVLCEFGTA